MKVLPALLALLVAASGCAPKFGGDWRPISEAGIKAMFPGEPAKTKRGAQTTFTLNRDGVTYLLTYDLSGVHAPDPEQLLDQLRNGFVRELNDATLLGERSLKAGGAPGREVTVDAHGYSREVVTRFYVAKSITYSAGVARPKGQPLSGDAEKFLDSVEVGTR